ncbi:CBS domain-containing protein [Psychrobacillus glaciei]|uniref:CBS domain-containing protein n=1 Tax=Psychrobacillus glaciei TaxID=2283160 RepID=A0A5J6SLB1_9BACI|nr:CBS domain-containing protein [Psychrobacillus glaciei]QFF98681.1 CBS domain-containing protein [Psychrobacillus glaciei]
MFVKSVMIPKEKCLTVNVNASLMDALQQLDEKEIDALPILENGIYKGMFNKYLLYKAFFYSDVDRDTFLKQTTVRDIAVREDTFVQLEDVFESALVKLYDFPIIAVLDEGKFLGIVTRYDTILQFRSAFGMESNGTRIALTSVESEGRILKVADILKKYHTPVISLVTFDETDKIARRIVLKIDNDQKLNRIIGDFEKSGFRVLHINKDE